MNLLQFSLPYVGAASAIGLSSLGVAIGQGLSSRGSHNAIIRQEESARHITQLQILGLVLIESGAALGLLFTLLILNHQHPINLASAITLGVCGLSFGISALFASIASGSAVSAAGEALSRQPFLSKKISTMMVMLQAVAETPIIFSLITNLLIINRLNDTTTMPLALQLCAASLTLCIATIGPALAQAILAAKTLAAVGLNQNMYSKIFTLTLLGEAFIETPILFAFILALRIINSLLVDAPSLVSILGVFGITLASGLGSAGPAIGSAWMTGKAAENCALNPVHYNLIFKTTFMSQVLIETGAIYSLMISFMIASIIF